MVMRECKSYANEAAEMYEKRSMLERTRDSAVKERACYERRRK